MKAIDYFDQFHEAPWRPELCRCLALSWALPDEQTSSKVPCDQSFPKLPLNSATHFSKSEMNKGRDKATC